MIRKRGLIAFNTIDLQLKLVQDYYILIRCFWFKNYFYLLNEFHTQNKKFAKIFRFRWTKEKKVEHRTIKLIYGNYGLKATSTGF